MYREIAEKVRMLTKYTSEGVLGIHWLPMVDEMPEVQISRKNLNKLEDEFGAIAKVRPFGANNPNLRGNQLEFYVIVDGAKFFAIDKMEEGCDGK